ncbi:hypothetical protein QVD17_19961 [Tagetes erecta]|uniref:Uncharacterized protein n=1 Tax=Tagetes erecta TaxID=13708 RepID=A0AAD8KN96_TARER|nr:hypothetical protein QVD17_19961 [Tagetes erecta]
MGDSNVESSNLARKVMKIDGNPRVNLLRGSSKGNDASKTNSSSRYPVRGTAVDSKMMINPKVNDHTADVSIYPAGVDPHPASGSVDPHPSSGSVDPAMVDGHPATGIAHPARVGVHPAKGIEVHPASVHPAAANAHPATANAHLATGLVHPATGFVHPATGIVHPATGDTVYTAEGDINSDDITNVIHESNAGDKLIEQEAELLASLRVASLDEERFLKQKSKVHWLAEGDANTKYFHNTLKCRNHRARIDVITDRNGILHEGKEVPKAFVDHYVGFLGREEAVTILITHELFDVRIDQAMSVDMIREVTADEIKRTIFAFADDKAPGPDGFTAAFYKKAWEIVDDLFLFARGELSSAKEL